MKKTLVVMALTQESQGHFEKADIPVLYTGIGKVNAAFALAQKLAEQKPDMVLNLGTAGSFIHKRGELLECVEFVQRDMDLTGAGAQKYQTLFDDLPGNIAVPAQFPKLNKAVCGTGDSFHMSGASSDYSVMDMEAYALAKVCARLRIPFASVKYITDGADGDALQDWRDSLKAAAKALFEFYLGSVDN